MENDAWAILIAKYGIMSGAAAYIGSLALKRWAATKEETTSSGARVDVIDLLANRVKALEDSVKTAQGAFDTERQLRLDAQAKVASLLIRVGILESQVRALGHDPSQ